MSAVICCSRATVSSSRNGSTLRGWNWLAKPRKLPGQSARSWTARSIRPRETAPSSSGDPTSRFASCGWTGEGQVLERIAQPGHYKGLALAPGDARAVLVRRAVRTIADQDLWLLDLPSGRSSRVTFEAALEDAPVWSADGTRLVFTTGGAIGSLYEQSIGGEHRTRLLESPQHKVPTSMSRDGQFLLYWAANIGATRMDVWALPLTRGRTPYPLIRQPFDQHGAQFSPDGRWVAYVSNESGRQEVLIRPFAADEASANQDAMPAIAVSQSGGTRRVGTPMATNSSSSR